MSSVMPSARSERLAALRAEVRALERRDGREARAALPFGVPAIDTHLADGGIAPAALHEACGAGDGSPATLAHHAAATLFLAGIAARLTGPVLWVLRRRDLFAPALRNAGLAADRLIYAEAGIEADVLAVMEDALRHGALAAVIGETARAGLTVTRRLQLAAEEGGTIALLLRTPRRGQDDPLAEPSAAVTRWRVGCAPSAPLSIAPAGGAGGRRAERAGAASFHEDVPGIGRPRWRLELARQRGGEQAEWLVEANDDAGRLALSSGVRDRSAAPRQRPRVQSRDAA